MSLVSSCLFSLTYHLNPQSCPVILFVLISFLRPSYHHSDFSQASPGRQVSTVVGKEALSVSLSLPEGLNLYLLTCLAISKLVKAGEPPLKLAHCFLPTSSPF